MTRDPVDVVGEQVVLDHLQERLADDGLMHQSGCRICEAVFRCPLDRQLALIQRAAHGPAWRSAAPVPASPEAG